MKKYQSLRAIQAQRFLRYSIRKFTVGVASVAIASGLAVLGGTNAQAAEEVVTPATETKVQEVGKNIRTEVAEKVNTSKLSEAIERLSQLLGKVTETEKTTVTITEAKELLSKVKQVVSRSDIKQSEVDTLTSELTSKAFVLESMPKEKDKTIEKEADKSTEEKVNKNQDPRNGKAIPGKGESGFRADTYKLDDSNNAQLPDTATTGTDKFTFVALPENDSRRNSGAIAIGAGGAGDVVVNGTGAAPTDLEIEMYSSQRTGQAENPKAMSTVNGQPATSPGRMDYPLSKEQVQKLQEEAKLWVGKEKPDGNRVTTNLGAVYGSSGAYEFLATEIYKLGYEQGVDRVYIPNISNRFGVSEKAKGVGWKIKSIEPSNLPPGLIYDRESDSIQGRVVANLQNGVYDFRFDVAAENERTHQIVRMKFQNLRSGWIGWQDTQPPKIEVSNDAYEATVGQDVNIEVKYSDDAGSNFSGDKRRVKYTLKDGRVVEIGNQSYRQAVSGLAGHPTTKNQGVAPTSIPGVNYDLSRDKTPTEKEANGDEKIFGKGILTGSPTKAGIYTVSVFAKDYNNRNKSDTTWIHSGHEVQKYMTVVVKPTATVKNVHAYATNIPVTISEGASSAELTLPNGKVIKLEAKNGNWTLADGGAVLGPVGGEINVPVSQEDTKDAAVDTIKVKAITENVKATLLRNEIELLGDDGQKHTARLSETTGHWELEDAYKEVRTPTADGGYKLTKRQVYTEVQADGSTNYYIYSYTRTFNANDKVVSVDEVTRPKTVVPRLNTENTDGATTTVEYDAVTKEWKSSDGSNVTATKEGDFWKVRTDSGFTGLIKGSKAESVEDKGSILNDAPTATSTSYTAVKGATVDLVKQASAAVTKTDLEDDSTTSPKKETTVTKVTVTSPSGQQSEYTDLEQAKAHLLSEVGTYTVKVEVKDSNGNVVTANTDTETGTDKGAETAVNSTTYTITVKDQETKKLYKVEDDTVTNDELKGKVEPTTIDGFTPTKNDFTNIPTTAGKAGQTIPTPASVTYTKGTETIPVETKVDVVVLPKVEPTGVTVLKDSTGLDEAVKAKAVEAAKAVPTDKLPDGVTVSVKEVKQGTVPATSTNGVQTPATVVVEYKDVNNNVVATKEVPVPVTVVSSTPSKIVVFEGEKPTADQAKAAVTPGTDGTKGEPTTLPETAGKAGATDVKVDVPVTYDNGKLTETVSVPVTVLPKASGEVEVPKGESVDKVKEVAKTKAAALVEAADFKGKLPTGATVTVGDITDEVLATITAEKGTNKGIVNVPATYTVDGTTYNTTVPVTINVLGSETKPVYTVEGTKPDAEKVKNAVTPGTEGTVNAPTEAGLPETTGKAGATDVTATTTVTYPNGTETVTVPVTVLPKATPEKVITLKDTTGDNLTTAVKEKAQAALGKLTLPTGVTVELVPNQTYTVPATDSNGDKDNVPVKVQYKDATGTVVAEDTINVPVTVVSSTPSKIVVFEGEKPTADQAKEAVTPGADGTKGEPTTLPETAGKAGATDVKVDVPVTYDNGKLTETVSVPVTVLPKASGEVEVPKGSAVDKVKEVAKAKAQTLIEAADFKGKLPTGATVTVGDITEAVAETLTNEKGTNKGVVNVPATYTVDGTTYNTTVPVTINVAGSEAKPVYTVEGTKPDAEKVKNAVTPGTEGTVNAPTEAGLPETTGKAGATDVTATTTVTYPNGTETVTVPVTVLPKATPEKVTTLKDTTGDNLTTAVKEKAQAALGKLTLPSGVTVELDPNQTYTVPATTSNGDKDNVPVKVQYKDATGTVVAEDTINVPVTVVSSTPSKIVVFEGEKPTADQAKEAVTPGADGTKGEPTTLPETAGKAGATDVKVDVPVTYDNGKLTETVSVPVTVLPKPEAEGILVAKNSDKEKAKEKVLAKAKKAIEDATFKGKLPQGTTVTVDETATITVPDLTEDTEVDVMVKYNVDGQEKTTTVKVPVSIVEGVPQIVPVKENNDVLPDPEKSIDKTDYPEGSTFRYKTPDGQTTPIDVTTTGDKNVVVEVLDPQGNTIVEVPATVRVVGSTPQFVVADPAKKQPEAKDSVTPGEYPEGTTFEYKTPIDTTSAGEKDVTVVAKLNGQPIAEVPAKVVVVDPKTQYVVADPSKPQPDASKSIDPEQYPEGTTFEYKTPVDTTTPGEKDVVVVAKDGEDKLVEVPTKVKVVQGNPQIVPVDEGKKQPSPEDSIDSNDYPDDATFEYKEEVDTSTPGDKKVTVVVKQGDKVLVEVPSTVRVVESYPKYVPVDPAKKQPDPKENINPNDFPTGTTFEYKDNTPVDTTTPGEKPVTVVAKLNGQPITEIPATIVVVESKTQYVPVNAENDKKPKPQDSITPDDYPEGSTFEYKTPEGQTTPYDGTTPGEKDVTVVVKDSDGDTIVEVPAKIKVVQGKEQLTPVNAEDKDKPKAEDSITPSDYPEGSTFEYKVPEGQTTPYDGTTPGDKPVTVVVKDKDGKVLVEVPATIKVVESKPKPIETPVTNTPLEKDDYTKGLNVPDGATVEVVGGLPDLTTPGEKTPVKVTITLPNGKSYTVDVPVTVTPVKEIETPVTNTPLTPEDYRKGIKIPEGGKVTNVENIPDLTTPGKKDPVKVTVELPNGKTITVDVPVNVTPVKEIETPVTNTPLTPEDYRKGIKIPEGGKVTNVENIPDLTTPGKKDPVKVTVELPNGKTITVDVPVNVTPVKEIETPVTNTPLTPEDYRKGIKIPEGGKVTNVENIPDLTTPGKKDPVKVTVELPNGKVIIVDIPVTVTPVKEIETPVTNTPLTPEDYTKGIKIPEGGKVTNVENIPDLTTPGKKDPVKVTIELPNGKVITVDVPVTVTPKSQNGGGAIAQNGNSTQVIVTEYLDENGNRITSDKEGKHNPIELEGYEFSHSTTDAKGNTLHHYKKVTPKTPQAVEEVPTTKPEQPSTPEAKPTPVAKQELPNTGTAELEVFTPAALAILTGLGLAAPTVAKKKDEE